MPSDLIDAIRKATEKTKQEEERLPPARPNLFSNPEAHTIRHQKRSIPLDHRYYINLDNIQLPPTLIRANMDLVRVLENIKRRHDPVVATMAQGIREFKNLHRKDNIDLDIQNFLDRFYLSRIGIRMLIGQHVALNQQHQRSDYVGIICTRTQIAEIAEQAAADARRVCEDYYGLFHGPEIHLHCPKDLEFAYVPSHLHHMLFELLKNSLRAVVELYGSDNEDQFTVFVRAC